MSNIKSWIQGFDTRRWFLSLAIVMLVYLLWLILAQPSPGRAIFAMILVLLTRVVALRLSLQAHQRLSPSAVRIPWRYIAVAMGLWVIADGLVILSLVFQGTAPERPSAVELFRLAGYLAALLSVAIYPVASGERLGRLRDLLDVSILFLAMFALSWLVFIRAVVDVGASSVVLVIWGAISPVFDLALFMVLMRAALLGIDRPDWTVFWLMAGSFALLAISDLVFGYLSLALRPALGSLIEVGWILGGVLLASAAYQYLRPRVGLAAPRPPAWSRRLSRKLEPLLPYGFTYIIVGLTVIDWWMTGSPDGVAIATAAVISLLLVARQGAIAGQIELRQYVSLINAANDLAFVCEQSGQMRIANPALREVIGRRRVPIQDLNLLEFLEPPQPQDEILEQAAEDGWSGEVIFRHRDGSGIPVLLAIRPVYDERQNTTVLTAIGHNLTEVKARERELQSALDEVAEAHAALESLNSELEEKVSLRTRELQTSVADLERLNEELKELDRLKSDFVTLVSHELRAPLSNIRNGIELVLEHGKGVKAPDHETLSLVQAETDRLNGFVSAILDLSALDAGRFPINSRPMGFQDLAKRVCAKFVEPSNQDRLRLAVAPDLPPVIADERALSSILFHIMDNALKYAPEGDVRVQADLEEDQIRVAVHDQGSGIPEGERERVFEMFHRLDSSDAREIYGHGLGLHLTRRFIEAMGGRIRILDSPDGGAQVVFWLPKAEIDPALEENETL